MIGSSIKLLEGAGEGEGGGEGGGGVARFNESMV